MRIDIKHYLAVHNLTIYQVSKRSGYGYTTLHKSFNKPQSSATPLNLSFSSGATQKNVGGPERIGRKLSRIKHCKYINLVIKEN